MFSVHFFYIKLRKKDGFYFILPENQNQVVLFF